MKWLRIILVFSLISAALAGLSQQRFVGDIYSLLPADLAVIDALKTQQDAFSRKQELLISLRSGSAERSAEVSKSLSQRLAARSDVQSVIWQEPSDEELGLETEMLAYRWLNAEPQRVQTLAKRFSPDKLEAHLQTTVDQALDAFDPYAAAVLLGDPMGLLQAGDEEHAVESIAFTSSADGLFRVIYAQPSSLAGDNWFSLIEAEVSAWQQQNAPMVQFRYAGNPAFFNEFSTSLSRDLLLSVIATALCVALLFWLAHRRFRPLLWMLTLLSLVLLSTVSIGGQLLGELNIISLGYAAVLMGLAADYGLILYQEHRLTGDTPKATSKTVAPSILWAALSTAGAFLCVSRGSLPGMTQLGVLVALGVLIAAVVMIVLFLPLVGADDKLPIAAPMSGDDAGFFIRPKTSLLVSLAAICVAVAVILFKPPSLDSSPNTLGPAQTDSFQAMAEIQAQLERDPSPLFLLFDSTSPSEVESAFASVAPLLETAQEQRVLKRWQLPTAVWPKPDNQQANLASLLAIADSKRQFVEAAGALGLGEDSQELTISMLDHFTSMANRSLPLTASSEQGAWLLSQAMAVSPTRYLALGGVSLHGEASQQQLLDLEQQIATIPSVRLAGWPLASPALLSTMKTDLGKVALPMGILLLMVLLFAFRGVAEVALSLVGLITTLLLLVATMSLLGWAFNLMNILALPLLLGVTVDYSIHVQLALQRYRGDRAKVHATVGKAILLAGATTASAFGSLAFASNEGLASLGKISALGVAIACFFSVYILPGCWLFWRRKIAYGAS